jgi:hypothetical protein
MNSSIRRCAFEALGHDHPVHVPSGFSRILRSGQVERQRLARVALPRFKTA